MALSCVNNHCFQFLTPLTEGEVEQLGLHDLDNGIRWATLKLATSPTSNWSICVRWSPDSVFDKNLLCVRHSIIRGAVLGLVDFLPRLQLKGKVFGLLRDEEADA